MPYTTRQALGRAAFRGLLLLVPLFAAFVTLTMPPRSGRALPPAGTDTLNVSGTVSVTSRLGSETIPLSGTVTIQRGDPRLDGGVEVVDAEIVSMSLTGASLTGPISAIESPTRSSTGQIRSLQPPPDQFPASSFFDVFIQVQVPASPSPTITLSNTTALRVVPRSGGVEVPINAWPPSGVTYEKPSAPCVSLLPNLPAQVCVTGLSIVLNAPTTPVPTSTRTATPTLTATPTVTPTKQPAGDTDGDGCADSEENGANPTSGGRRDYRTFWDFFDVWTTDPENPLGWTRDQAVTLTDVFAVARRFGAVRSPTLSKAEALAEALTPPPPLPAAGAAPVPLYHAAYDRGGQVGPNVWNQGPPDGSIALADVFAVAAQFGHNCLATP